MNKPALFSDKNYLDFLHGIKDRIISARINAARSVNRELISLYWYIGRGIVEKQKELGWGESVVEMLSRDLRRSFPAMKGFSVDNLWRMRRFYNAYSAGEFLAQAVPVIMRGDVGSKTI
jgi:predicted nuclease of restriction endonuclease-like (RecB) superfamily